MRNKDLKMTKNYVRTIKATYRNKPHLQLFRLTFLNAIDTSEGFGVESRAISPSKLLAIT